MNAKKLTKNNRKPTEVRRRQIVEAAMRIIATEGARQFTAKRIASEIGVTSGAIFRHFETMDAIVEEIVNHMEKILFEGFSPRGSDPLRQLESFFMNRISVIYKNQYLSRLLLSDHLAQIAGKKHSLRIEKFKRRSVRFVKDCLTRHKKQNSTASGNGCGTEEGTVLLMGAIFVLAHARTKLTEEESPSDIGQRVWSILYKTFSGLG